MTQTECRPAVEAPPRPAADDLLDWYRSSVRPLLEAIDPGRVAELDDDARRVESLVRAGPDDLTVCFLGTSGVGKSTLINALVAGADTIVPSGGIGPLTAQAIAVRYARHDYFEIEYQSAKMLWRMTFGLRRSLDAETRRDDGRRDEIARLAADGLDDADADDDGPEDADAATGELKDRRDQIVRQARLLITGQQDGDASLGYLVDSLLSVMNKPRENGTAPDPADADRVRTLRSVLAREDRKIHVRGDHPQYAEILAEHAKGFLSPLIRHMWVHADAPLLAAGVCLVDLPGVGISGDVYQSVTRKYVREDARVVVLVVDSRGVTEANADLLRTTGFLNRLLYSADDPAADPAELMVVVVRTDVIADERYA